MCAPFSFNMAQVKKFQQGGSTVELFDIGGRNVNKNDFIYLAKKNWNTFKSNYNISGDDEVSANDAFDKIIQGIEKGDISSMSKNGELIDKTGELSNSSQPNDPYGKAAQFLWELSTGMDTQREADKKKGIKFEDTRGALGNIINNNFYGGNYTGSDQDIKLWLNQDEVDGNGVRSRVKRMNTLAGYLERLKSDIDTQNIDYEGSKYKDKNDRITHINDAINLLKKGEYNDNVIRALMDVGDMTSAQAMSWLADGTEQPTQSTEQGAQPTREEAIKAQAQAYMTQHPGVSLEDAMRVETARYDSAIKQNQKNVQKEIDDINFNDWYNEIAGDFKPRNFNLMGDQSFNINNYLTQKLNPYGAFGINKNVHALYGKLMSGKNRSFIDYWNSASPSIRRQLRALLEIESNYADNESDGFTQNLQRIGNGIYVLNGYNRYNKGYTWVYDKNSGELRRMKTSDSDILSQANRDWWNNNISIHKNGGIIMARQGVSFAQMIQEDIANSRKAEQKQLQEKAKETGRPQKAIENGSKKANDWGEALDNMDTANKVRFYSGVADLAGAVASFVPGYGNAISLIQGLASDVGRGYADLQDGYSLGEVGTNFAKGLGMTVIGALPLVGTGSKLTKAWKGVRTFVPWVLSVGASVTDVGAAKEAYDKIEAGKGTVDDYMTIVRAMTAVANTTKLGSSTLKARAVKNAANTGKTDIVIQGKKGDIKLTQQQLDQLKTAKTTDEMNQMVRQMGHNDDIAFGRSIRGDLLKPTDNTHFWNQSVKVRQKPVYDFSLIDNNSMYRKGPLSEVGMMSLNVNRPSWLHLPSFGYKPTVVQRTASIQTPVQNPIAPSISTAPPQRPKVHPDNAIRIAQQNLARTRGWYKNGGKLEKIVKKYQAGGNFWDKMREEKEKQQGWNEYTTRPIDETYSLPTYHRENMDAILHPYVALYPENVKQRNTANGGLLNSTSTHTNITGQDVDSVMRNYLKNIGRLRSDIQSYSDNGKYEDINKFLTDYNNDITLVNNSWKNKDVYPYNKRGWSKHNQAHQRLYNSINDPFVGELKYNVNIEDILGSTTAHRVADNYDKKYADLDDLEKQNRIHTVKLNNGSEYQVYKEDDGTLHLLPPKTEPQPTPETPKSEIKPSTVEPQPQNNPTVTKPNQVKPNGFDPTRLGAEALALRTALDTIRTNNLLADRSLKKQLPLKNPNSMVAPTADVYNILANGQQNAGQVATQGRQIQNATANTEQGLLARLEASRNAAKLKQEAGFKADEKRQLYADKAVEVGNYNHAQEVETGNFNNAQLINKKNMDIDILNGRDAANSQVRNALSDKYELELRQRLAKNEAKKDYEEQKAEMKKEQVADMQEQWNQRQAMLLAQYKMKTDKDFVNLSRQYDAAIKANDTAEANKIKKDMEIIQNRYQVDAYNQIGRYSANRYGVNWDDLKLSTTPYSYSTNKYAKGGTFYDNIFKARIDDNRRFDKRILEGIKTTQRAIGDSSAITKAILNKLMNNWK